MTYFAGADGYCSGVIKWMVVHLFVQDNSATSVPEWWRAGEIATNNIAHCIQLRYYFYFIYIKVCNRSQWAMNGFILSRL